MSTILIVEDEHALGGALVLTIQRLGHRPLLAASGAAALERLAQERIDAVVLDIGLPDMSGVEVLERVRRSGSQIPVLVITAHAALEHAIASQKLGIADYLIKPLDLTRFEQSISALVATGAWSAEPVESGSTTLIGAAPRMHEVFLAVARACAGDMPVLVCGPCGSGKSLAARVIHSNSGRGNGPLRVLDCGGVRTADALRSWLEEGGGTLVLENLTSLTEEFQSILGEMLSQGIKDLPRLIATLREDPREAVVAGVLREDLYYAFSTLVIGMPPLAERTGDIPALSRFFFAMFGDTGGRVEITSQALCALEAYEWPGNVRELRHVLEHARAMSRGGAVFPGHLPPHVADALRASGGKQISGELDSVLARWLASHLEVVPEEEWKYDTLLDRIESAMLGHLLEKFENRPTRLAQALRMNRATLRQKLRRLGMREVE
jgi:DNA-binding NtrC family response regulator